MRVMVIVKATPQSEAGEMPSRQLLEDMGRFNEGLGKAGMLLDAAGLRPTCDGARVVFDGDDSRRVVPGPFSANDETVAGFWLWQVESFEQAIAWANRCPNPHPGQRTHIELRPLYEEHDIVVQ